MPNSHVGTAALGGPPGGARQERQVPVPPFLQPRTPARCLRYNVKFAFIHGLSRGPQEGNHAN